MNKHDVLPTMELIMDLIACGRLRVDSFSITCDPIRVDRPGAAWAEYTSGPKRKIVIDCRMVENADGGAEENAR